MTTETIKPEGKRLNLDVASMEANTASYPVDIGEGARWLAGFIRRRCNGEMPAFQGMLLKGKFSTTTDTISKILKGRYLSESGGKKSPVLKTEVFAKIVEHFQRQDKLLDLACGIPFVESATFERIRNYIMARQMSGRICKFGLIAGPTGAQKSASYKHLCRLDEHMTTFHYEAPEKANLGETVIDLCKLFGKTQTGASTHKKRELRECVKADTTLIIDNVQKLHKAKDGSDQRAFNYFQKLQDDTDCTLILSITYEFLHQFQRGLNAGYFEQFVGRCGGENKFLLLPPFAGRDEVLQFANHFQLQDAAEHLDYLEAVAQLPGRIRTLLQNLQDGKALAEEDGQVFAIEHLQQQFTNAKGEPFSTDALRDRCVERKAKI